MRRGESEPRRAKSSRESRGEPSRAESRVPQTKADGDAIARKWPTGRDDERRAGLTGRPALEGTGEKEGEGRKSSIVAEGTGRPSVASTCCASRSHFTPLSSPNSVPSFFFIFIPFLKKKRKFVLTHPENDDPTKIDSTPLLIPGFSSVYLPATRAHFMHHFINAQATNTLITPRCVLQSVFYTPT